MASKMPTQETIDTYKYSCPSNCQNEEHASCLLYGIRSIGHNDQSPADPLLLAAYIAKCCRNFARVRNGEGTTALHAIAQMCPTKNLGAIAEFLLNHRADANAVETKTGRTPLHYACMFSNLAVAVALLRRGATLEVHDSSNRHPLSYLQSPPLKADTIRPAPFANLLETWAWGDLRNHNLGVVRDLDDLKRPQHLEAFNRIRLTVRAAALSPLHSLFVTDTDDLYVVGNGQGGILGIENVNIILEPCKVEVQLSHKDCLRAVAASRFTSMLLTARGHVYTCGKNASGQLGYKCDQQNTFRRLRFPQTRSKEFAPTNIFAQERYSVAHNNDFVYVWGKCYGQFGSKIQKMDDEMVPINFSGDIRQVAVAKWSMAICMTYTLAVLNNYQTRMASLPVGCELLDMAIDSAERCTDEVRVILLTTESLMMWTSTIGLIEFEMSPIVLPELCCTQVLLNNGQLTYVLGGYVYHCQLKVEPISLTASRDKALADGFHYPSDYKPFVRSHNARLTNQKLLPLLDNVTRVCCDSDQGKTFVALQLHSNRNVLSRRAGDEQQMGAPQGFGAADLAMLWREASADDGIVDLVIVVNGGRRFPVHKYVLASRAPQMRWLFDEGRSTVAAADDEEKPPVARLQDDTVSPKMLELLLRYVYEYRPLSANDLDEVKESMGAMDGDTAYGHFCQFAKRCGLLHIVTNIGKPADATPPEPFNYITFTKMCDVHLICGKDGFAIPAHKCMLVARSEYFKIMFSRRWSGSFRVQLDMVNADTLNLILECIYTLEYDRTLAGQRFTDSGLFDLLVVCDHMMLYPMCTIIEQLLVERNTPKKCLEMLRFAKDVSLAHMQEECARYVHTNASRMLARRLLDTATADELNQLAAMMEQEDQLELDDDEMKTVRHTSLYYAMLAEPMSVEQIAEYVGDFHVDLEALPLKRKSNGGGGGGGAGAGRQSERSKQDERVPLRAADGQDLEVQPTPPSQPMSSPLLEEAAQIANSLCAEFDSWLKVSGGGNKRPDASTGATPKRPLPPIFHNSAERQLQLAEYEAIMQRLEPRVFDEAEDAEVFLYEPINLSMFAPRRPTRHIPQSQRRNMAANGGAPAAPRPRPESRRQPQNAWGIPANLPAPGADERRRNVATFFNQRSQQSQSSQSSPLRNPPPRRTNNENLRNIQRDEQRDKNDFQRMLNKSLTQTQTEEAAIAELKRFYSVDDVFDERITIDRVPKEATRSHCVWYENKPRN